MQLDPKIEAALNRQIKQEISAAYNYLAMTAHFEHMNLKGFAHWTKVQREEELTHANKIFAYIHDRGGKVVLEAVNQPKADYSTITEVFQAALQQEQSNTRDIHAIMKLAKEADDFATQSFMQWFVDEQVEEEKIVSEVLSLIEIAGDDRSALLVLNEELGKRAGE